MSSKKWLKCRLEDIQAELSEKHRVSKPVISRLLQAKDYRLRTNRKSSTAMHSIQNVISSFNIFRSSAKNTQPKENRT